MNVLGITETILRDQVQFFTQIREGEGIDEKIKGLAISSAVFLAIYGIVLGAGDSFLQALVTMVKLPVLFLISLAICAPSLHIFYILFGARQTIKQTITLLLTSVGTTSLLLLGLAPITVFFLITSDNYYFYKILNVAVLGLSGFLGTNFLRRGINIVINTEVEAGQSQRGVFLTVWVLLYGFVGAQMAYSLAPFVGDPDIPFILFANQNGNFFVDVIESIVKVFY